MRKVARRHAIVMALAMLGWLAQPIALARADWPLSFALVTCSPELGVFRLATLQGNEPTTGDPRRIGAFTATDLEAAPSICELPNYRIVVDGRYIGTGHGPCGAIRGQQARVSVNGAPVEESESPDQPGSTQEGWIELTHCLGTSSTVEVHVEAATGAWAYVEYCQFGVTLAVPGVSDVSGQCRSWRSGVGFIFAAPH